MLLELFRNHKRWLMFIAMVLVIPSFVVTGIYSYNRMISDDELSMPWVIMFMAPMRSIVRSIS